jgi:hypothetical protein
MDDGGALDAEAEGDLLEVEPDSGELVPALALDQTPEA